MKTVKIIGTSHPFRGGLATYNERLAREYLNLGYTVEIETFTLQYPKFLFPGKTQYSASPAPENLEIRQTINSVNPFNWLKNGLRIKKEKPDLVVIKYWLPFMAPCFATLCWLIKRNRHSRVVCIADNIIPHENKPGYNLLTGLFLKTVDGVVAQSKSVYNDVFKFTNKIPVTLCPHPMFDNFGTPLPREKALETLGLSPEFRYVLFFGFIRDYKGLDLLLKAFATREVKNLNIKLIVAGEFYSKPDFYLDLIKSLDIENQVILKTDFIDDKDVNIYFSSADIIAQPYKTATQSGVTQIGYHFNKPMLVTNVGGLPEIIPDGVIGYVVEPEENQIASALSDFFTSGKKALFEKNILEEKKKYLWSAMVKAIESLYLKKQQL